MKQAPDIGRVKLKRRLSRLEQTINLRMLDHDTLWHAGGPGGVDDVGQMARIKMESGGIKIRIWLRAPHVRVAQQV